MNTIEDAFDKLFDWMGTSTSTQSSQPPHIDSSLAAPNGNSNGKIAVRKPVSKNRFRKLRVQIRKTDGRREKLLIGEGYEPDDGRDDGIGPEESTSDFEPADKVDMQSVAQMYRFLLQPLTSKVQNRAAARKLRNDRLEEITAAALFFFTRNKADIHDYHSLEFLCDVNKRNAEQAAIFAWQELPLERRVLVMALLALKGVFPSKSFRLEESTAFLYPGAEGYTEFRAQIEYNGDPKPNRKSQKTYIRARKCLCELFRCTRAQLEKGMSQLEKTERDILFLYYERRFCLEEIAAATGISVGEIGTRREQAKNKLSSKIR